MWFDESVFYQIYPLGFCGAERENDFGEVRHRFGKIEEEIDYINAHYSDSELTLREIARALFVHENYLSRLFKSSMNVSFREYLTQKRIETSVSLMDQGYRSIRKIAELVGYSDALYFSKSFKKLNSCSPREHLRKITEKLEKTDPPPTSADSAQIAPTD